jgi:hypothetical protein
LYLYASASAAGPEYIIYKKIQKIKAMEAIFLYFLMIHGLEVSCIMHLTRLMGFFMVLSPIALPIAPEPCIIDASSSWVPAAVKTEPFLNTKYKN